MRVRALAAGGGLLVALIVMSASAGAVHAYSRGRLALRTAAIRMEGTAMAGPAAGVRLLTTALREGHLDTVATEEVGRAAESAAGRGDAAPATAAALVSRMTRVYCGTRTAVLDESPAVAPGDVLVIMRGGAQDVALAVDDVDVVEVDPGSHVVLAASMRRLLGDQRSLGLPGQAVLLSACAPSAAVLPDAADTATRGGVALGDVTASLDRLGDAGAHPRDGDSGLRHSVARTLGAALHSVGWLLGRLGAGFAAGLDWLHARLGTLGMAATVPSAFAAWLTVRALRTTLDLRGVHAVLSWGVAALLVMTPPGVMAAGVLSLAAGVGLLTGRWGPRDVGALALAAAWNVAVFTVDLTTGIDGSGHTSVGVVVFAVVTDVLLLCGPIDGALRLAGTRLLESAGARGAGGGARMARWAETAAGIPNGLTLHPSTLRDGAAVLLRRGGVHLEAGTLRGDAGWHWRRTGWRLLDLTSAPLRGAATQGDVTGVVAHAAHAVAPQLARAAAADELTGGALDVALGVLDAAEHASTLHGVAHSLAATLDGEGPVAWAPRPLPRPDPRLPGLVDRLRRLRW